jgi:hypothetical protein
MILKSTSLLHIYAGILILVQDEYRSTGHDILSGLMRCRAFPITCIPGSFRIGKLWMIGADGLAGMMV